MLMHFIKAKYSDSGIMKLHLTVDVCVLWNEEVNLLHQYNEKHR